MSTWPQCAFLYDGTFAGFLSCVGESFRRKEYPFYFLPPGAESSSPYPLREIATDPFQAKTVYEDLTREVSLPFRQLVEDCFRTSLPQKERHIYDAVYLGLTHALPGGWEDERVQLLMRAVDRERGPSRQRNSPTLSETMDGKRERLTPPPARRGDSSSPRFY